MPVNYNNFDIDASDMIYTTRNDVESNVSQVRKLNYYGNSLLVYKTAGNTRTYGDIETYYDNKNGLIQSIISDIDVDTEGYFSILDTRRNRIFQLSYCPVARRNYWCSPAARRAFSFPNVRFSYPNVRYPTCVCTSIGGPFPPAG